MSQTTNILAYQVDYQNGLRPDIGDVQIKINSQAGDIKITQINAQSYNTEIRTKINGSVFLTNAKITRFSEADTNQILISAPNKLSAANYQVSDKIFHQ